MLSLAELFRHQHLFIGMWGLRRVRRLVTGEILGRGRATCQVSADAFAASAQLATACLHTLPGDAGRRYDLLVTPLAFDDPGLGRCPALGDDHRCTLHGPHKPSVCAAVPFDPLVPDRLQGLVLADRWGESDDLGARCIARAMERERATVRGATIADDGVRRALASCRQMLAADKRLWASDAWKHIGAQVMAALGGPERIPSDGFVVIPLTPALELLAGRSAHCRERCLEYLDAQIVLGEVALQSCLRRKQAATATTVTRLRSSLRAHHLLRGGLLERPAVPAVAPSASVRDLEAWLDGGPCATWSGGA